MSSSRSHRFTSGISPFRSRKSPHPQPPAKSSGRPVTSSSTTSSRPPSRLSSPASTSASPPAQVLHRPETGNSRENVTVTVRFRPLSAREINKGDEIAWYADGDNTVRNEYNPTIAYGFDRVFGTATTTRHVYDIAAQHVVSGVMQGINGTVFAYGVTSSGKTHTMHGEQKSPGIIPLAVKDVFEIIQEMPGREFLLRVSYLEIYNEVINDLLDPTGQNLRIREDAQGTYVEGIKEEVVLSPAHAFSLIASGEEHRHVGSTNFNLLSSRSHTIFTLTVESSPHGENQVEADVTLSRLHLIDLAGSESSKTETIGLRRKEGSYINKSLLTLGTVISKLTDGKATHIPYRDSKLTRLLQSSLSGHGRISLICTVTPASSNSEETHNTLKFAHRSKHVEIKAAQNKIIEEKSLIKKYQKEISFLKQELQQLKRGMMENPFLGASTQEDLVNLKLQLEAGQVKLQSRLEEEEQAKAALLGRIQRLTKLILVSTKNSMQSSIPERAGHRRRHSFGEDELAYLPERKREYMIEDDTGSYASEISAEGREDATNLDELVKDYKRNRRHGMLGWFKMRKPESQSANGESSESESSTPYSKPLVDKIVLNDTKDERIKSLNKWGDDPLSISSFPEKNQAGDLFSATVTGRRLPLTGATITDQMDLLREQMKMLIGEVALSTSSLKRLSEQAAGNSEDSQLKERMRRLKSEISEKKRQIRVLEQRLIGTVELTPHTANSNEMSQALSKFASQLNEKTFELEIKSADNRILQEQLQTKTLENAEMQETILLLRKQLSSLSDRSSSDSPHLAERNTNFFQTCSKELLGKNIGGSYDEAYDEENTPTSVMSLNRIFLQDSNECSNNAFFNSQLLVQAAEIENLKQEKVKLIEEKEGVEIHCKKLAEETSYAKELAAAAAVELRNLAEEVTRLSYENVKLSGDLTAVKEASCKPNHLLKSTPYDYKEDNISSVQPAGYLRIQEDQLLVEELQKELNLRCQAEVALQNALTERDEIESDLQRRLEEAKLREEDLENELANMWVMVSKMRNSSINGEDLLSEAAPVLSISQEAIRNGFLLSNVQSFKVSKEECSKQVDEIRLLEELNGCYQEERKRCKELEVLVSRLKGENIGGMDVSALEELQNFHLEAITKICHAKCALH